MYGVAWSGGIVCDVEERAERCGKNHLHTVFFCIYANELPRSDGPQPRRPTHAPASGSSLAPLGRARVPFRLPRGLARVVLPALTFLLTSRLPA